MYVLPLVLGVLILAGDVLVKALLTTGLYAVALSSRSAHHLGGRSPT